MTGNAQRAAGGLNQVTIPMQGQSMVQGSFTGYGGGFNSPQIIRDSNGTPYPGNIIPSAQTSKNGMALLSVYPNPNLAIPQGANNYFAAGAAPRSASPASG